MIANAHDADDVIVAQVDGRPVWSSCVAAQARARGLSRDAALKECIDFELLAQAAERRQLASDHEVVVATRTALVNQVVAKEFEASYRRPEDFGDGWNRIAGKNLKHVDHEEYRGSTYVRVAVAEKASPAEETAAHELANRIAAAVDNEPGLMPSQFIDIAQKVADKAVIQHGDAPPYTPYGLEKAYADALFALPEVGRASPAVRTKWGWDIVLFTELVPPAHPSQEQIVHDLLPGVQQAYFPVWVNKIERTLGVHVEVDKDSSARLERMQ
jgi:hypothetical protein